MKIKHTVYIFLLFFSLVPLYIFGIFMMYENDKKIETIMRDNLAAISEAQIMDMNNFCEMRRERLVMIAQYELVHQAIRYSFEENGSLEGTEKDYLENMLIERKRYNSFIESVSVVNRECRVVASSEVYNVNELSNLQYTQEQYLTGEFKITNVYERETDDGIKRVVAAFQGITVDDKLVGYVVEEIDVSYFDQYRTEKNLLENGTLYLLDGNQEVITAGSPGEESRDSFITTEEDREDYRKAWADVDREKNPSGEISYHYGGNEYITYYSYIDYTDWDIQITVNLSAYQDSRNAYKVLLLITIVVVTALLMVINYFITGRLTNAIENITGTLKKVQEEQNYALRIENYGKDELGVLACDINHLLNYIEKENLQEKEQQRHLAIQAKRDPLTGINNKKAIEENIWDLIQQAREQHTRVAVAFLDIDDFKGFNTDYGHMAGDRVIQFVASVLERNCGAIVGRNGGDEFLFGIGDVGEEELEKMADKLLANLNEGFYCKEAGKRVSVACSIGIVIAEGDDLSYSSLICGADEVMYQAKYEGKNAYLIKNMKSTRVE